MERVSECAQSSLFKSNSSPGLTFDRKNLLGVTVSSSLSLSLSLSLRRFSIVRAARLQLKPSQLQSFKEHINCVVHPDYHWSSPECPLKTDSPSYVYKDLKEIEQHAGGERNSYERARRESENNCSIPETTQPVVVFQEETEPVIIGLQLQADQADQAFLISASRA
ncbi:unnamed protein product [Acanthosepion pharaonis]|uniref:Uncharacterized protein n=1 Tax=Acanthosepion pharaonis TaxID=158019 RepID=A0A812BZ71_ACAPH|nr:unnamed protein product [Sepia pharaonis]